MIISSRWANPETNDAVLPQNPLYDWIILEGAYDQLHTGTVDLVERLLSGERQGRITAFDGYRIRIPRTMNFIIECDKMSALNPANLADISIVNLESHCFNLEQEFKKKITSLAEFGDYFVNIQSLLMSLFKDLIHPTIQNAETEHTRQVIIIFNELKINNF